MAQRKELVNPFWFVIPDLGLMALSLYIILFLKYGNSPQSGLIDLHYQIFGWVFIVWLLILFIHNLFSAQTLRSYSTLFFNLISATFFNSILAVIFFYFQPNLILTPRRTLIGVIILSFVLILFWHLIIKFFLKNRIVENYYLFSENGELSSLYDEINQLQFSGLRMVKHVNNLSDLPPNELNKVIIHEKLLANNELLKKIYELRLKGTSFYSPIEFYEMLYYRVPLIYLGELWLLNNIAHREGRLHSFVKRLVDLIFGIFFGVIFLVTFPLILGLIKINSPGPLFFIQARIGKNGAAFNVYKYRTMAQNPGTGWTKSQDPRITAVGKLLRRLHLDELPQFINLLLGNMSIVGPRPEQLEIVQQLRQAIPFYDERHLVKPGLTGWAQLHIYAATLEETRRKLEYDLYYLKHRSILFDLEIILKTIYFIIRKP